MSSAESARIIGLRVNAQAIPVPTPIRLGRGRQPHRLGERAAKQLDRPDAVDPGRLGVAGLLGEVAVESPSPAIWTRSRRPAGSVGAPALGEPELVPELGRRGRMDPCRCRRAATG